MNLVIDPATVRLFSGFVYLLMSVFVWLLMFRRHALLPLSLWTLGGVAMFVGVWLGSSLVPGPELPRVVLANSVLTAAALARTMALRCYLGLGVNLRQVVAGWLALVAVSMPLAQLGVNSVYTVFSHLCWYACLGALAWHAWQVARRDDSRSSWMLMWAEIMLIASLVARTGVILAQWPDGRLDEGWSLTLLLSAFTLSAVYSNLCYMGIVLDSSRASEARAREAQVAEAARREVAERSAAMLRETLQQRDRLADERSQLLQVLAHEIRQPLHNASGALQAAGRALKSPGAEGLALASQRLQRADKVLSDVHSVLDNTLAATNLLARHGPLTLQDVEVDLVVDLALGDLPTPERARVQVQHQDGVQSAEFEPGLVRLALRNLLRNAFNHGGPDTGVTLRIEERDHPPALWLSVEDNGRGAEPALLEPPAPGDAGGSFVSRGLGLNIVRRVMALHEGRLVLAPKLPHGLVASLVFPLPAAEPAPPRAEVGTEMGAAAEAAPSAAPVQARISGARNT